MPRRRLQEPACNDDEKVFLNVSRARVGLIIAVMTLTAMVSFSTYVISRMVYMVLIFNQPKTEDEEE